MQSLRSRTGRATFRQKITVEEMARIRIKAFETMDKVNELFKQLPRALILVLRFSPLEKKENIERIVDFYRNLNQIRSTIRDHGNLVDRHTIMARR